MSSFYGNVDQLFIIVKHFATVDDMNKDLDDKTSFILVGSFVFVDDTKTVYQKQVQNEKPVYLEIGDFITKSEWDAISNKIIAVENEVRALKTRVTNLETQLNNSAQN